MKNNTTNLTIIPELAIRMNRVIGELCPVCTEATNASIGLEIVEEITKKPVCHTCAVEYGLDLAYLLNLAEASRLLAISERKFGVRFEKEHFPERFGLVWKEFNERDNVIQFPAMEASR
ncbi:MAG TPA: hypothetical protein VF571_15420 [Pyrinomonadaceae bacterium]